MIDVNKKENCEDKKYRILGSSHGFKNRTGPAGSTGSIGDRCLIRSGSLKKPKKWKNWPKTENRRFDRQNLEPERLNWFWPGSLNHKTHRFCLFFFLLILTLSFIFSSSLPPLPHTRRLPPRLTPVSSSRRWLTFTLTHAALSLLVTRPLPFPVLSPVRFLKPWL